MSVQSDVSRIQYTGNASTVTPYPIPFVFHESAHIRAVVMAEGGVQTELLLGSDFSVAGAGAKTGGALTTKAPLHPPLKLTIYREVPIVQQSQFMENGPLPASTVERTLDALTMICQQLARKLARTFRLTDSGPELGAIAMRGTDANSVMVVDQDGGFHLWSIQKLKEEITAIAAVPEMLQALMVQYPVGCLYFTLRTENPREILGFGEWRRYGAGRMVVSLDPESPMFSQVGLTGGVSEVSLRADQNGQHDHIVQALNSLETSPSGEHMHYTTSTLVTTQAGGGHVHRVPTRRQNADGNGAIVTGDNAANSSRNTSDDGRHTHTFTIPELATKTGGAHPHIFDIPEHQTIVSGEGEPHDNMPPYIVVNVWTRINSDAPEEGVGTLPFPADPTLYVDRVTGETRRLVVDNTVIGSVPVNDDIT